MSKPTDRSIEYNNKGVHLLESGNYRAARALFGAALQLKLADVFLRTQVGSVTQEAVEALTSESYTTAESLMAQADACPSKKDQQSHRQKNHLLHSMASTGSSSMTCTTESETSSATESDGDSSPETERQPYLYTKAFPDDGSLTSEAIVVFNMGLVHHLQEKSSTKARYFYEIAAALLSVHSWDQEGVLLCSAITNNFGVWLHDFGDTGNAHFCFGSLPTMLSLCDLPAEAISGFNSNLKLFNIPVFEVGQKAQQSVSTKNGDLEDECMSSSFAEAEAKDEPMEQNA